MKASLFSMLLLMGLAACSSSAPPPIQYYVLSAPASSNDSVLELASKPTVVIESVELAAYLRQSGMIIQTGDNQLQVSKSHLWAESLEQSVPNALVREFQRQSDDYAYYIKSQDWVGQTDYRLRLRIDSLQSTDQGEVVASGRYQLIPAADPDSATLVDFRFQREIQQDGYAQAVAQMNVLLGEIAAAILESVTKLAHEDNKKEAETW